MICQEVEIWPGLLALLLAVIAAVILCAGRR